ncbi:keratin, type I cytoskeletal 9-like [Daphnia pulex]|uniref:keratin, type I cytoskeletal 9-like n=1 Tax=Daphnia pulex TaxID=6669 RepID=UPI001EE0A463|nr:keratin, type I cytoskeletal 9-like [Daphnia pulex]
MASANDAMDAAVAAANSAVAAANRIDAVELQLTGIAQQLQLLLGGGGGAGGGGAGGGGAGGGGPGGGAGGGGPGGGGGAGGGGGGAGGGGAGGGGASQRRRIDTSCLEKLHGDASLAQLRSWRNRWNDFCHLNQLNAYPVNEQMAAFRMALDPAMQQVVEVALGILPTSPLSLSDVIDRITDHVRSKRNIALDRVAFDECRQHTSESFDDFYIRLRTLADAADMRAAC